jgi:hypothetical protein
MPEFAIVSTLVLVAAPIVMVGGVIALSLLRRATRTSRAEKPAESAADGAHAVLTN